MENRPHNEMRLLSDSLLGNRQSFGTLVALLDPQLRPIASHFAEKHPHLLDAEDLLQHAALDAFASLDDFRGESVSEFVAWLSRIIRNDGLDFVRRVEHARTAATTKGTDVAALTTLLGATSHTPPSTRAARAATESALRDAVSHLSPEEQAVISHRLAGGTLDDIARSTGMKLYAVHRVEKRAIAHLRDALGGLTERHAVRGLSTDRKREIRTPRRQS